METLAPMLAFAVLLFTLAVAAAWFGADSRDPMRDDHAR